MRPGMRLHSALLVLALTVTSLGVVPAPPASADSISDELARLRAQEAGQRASLDALAGQQHSAAAVLAALRAESANKQADFGKAAAEAQQLSDAVTQFKTQEATLQAAHDARRHAFGTQMR